VIVIDVQVSAGHLVATDAAAEVLRFVFRVELVQGDVIATQPRNEVTPRWVDSFEVEASFAALL